MLKLILARCTGEQTRLLNYLAGRVRLAELQIHSGPEGERDTAYQDLKAARYDYWEVLQDMATEYACDPKRVLLYDQQGTGEPVGKGDVSGLEFRHGDPR